METLPLFPGLFDTPAGPPAARGRRGKARASTDSAVAEAPAPPGNGTHDAQAATVQAVLPALGSGPVLEPVLHIVEPAPGPPRPLRPQERVLLFDVETTGTGRTDQVIELCMQRGMSGTDFKIWRFKPTVPIHPRAQKVHGISMEDLEGCPSFASCADEIDAWFAQADVIIGYNLRFDIEMVEAEYERAGRRSPGLIDKKVVDPFRLWQQREPRKLVNAHQRFVGNDFEAAHSAAADVAATGRVLERMLVAFGLDDRDWGELEKICDPERSKWVGSSRHVQWDEEGGFVVLSFGKHRDKPLHEVAVEDGSYFDWIASHDFPAHVSEICGRARELAHDGDGFHAWVRQRFGPPPGAAPFAARAVAAAG